MTREEFYLWLNTCPTHRWELTHSDTDSIRIMFPITSNDEEEDET